MTSFLEVAIAAAKAAATDIMNHYRGNFEVEIKSEVVEVIGIDRDTNMLKYKAPGKQVARVKVDPSVSTMDKLKPGEKILVTYTEAKAISVSKP